MSLQVPCWSGLLAAGPIAPTMIEAQSCFTKTCATLFAKQQRRWQKCFFLCTQLLLVFCKCYNLIWTIGFCCCCLIGMYITMARSQLTRWSLNRRCYRTLFITEWHASEFLYDSCICLVDNNLIWNTQQVLFRKSIQVILHVGVEKFNTMAINMV